MKSLRCPHQGQGYYLPKCNLTTPCPLQEMGEYSYAECNCINVTARRAQEIALHLGGKAVEGINVWQVVLSPLISSHEAAEMIGVSPSQFSLLAKQYRLKAIEEGKNLMWLKADIETIQADRHNLNQGTISTADLAHRLGVSPQRVRVIGKKFKQPAHGLWNLVDWLPILAQRGKE